MTSPRDLAERESKPIALSWITAAIDELDAPESELARAGLETSFAWRLVREGKRAARIEQIRATFVAIRRVLEDSARTFAGVSEEDTRGIFPAGAPPAYAVFGDRVYFTPFFAPYDPATRRGFGPLCRAAMVVHEAVHVIDAGSGAADVHISEWDEPRFSSLSPEQQAHNPSAYASFAGQVHVRILSWPREARFGAGNPEK